MKKKLNGIHESYFQCKVKNLKLFLYKRLGQLPLLLQDTSSLRDYWGSAPFYMKIVKQLYRPFSV